MNDEEELAVEPDGDPLPQTAEPGYALTHCIKRGWLDGAEQKRAGQADFLEGVADDPGLQSLDIGRDVRKFRHELSIIGLVRTFRILVGGWLVGGVIIVILSSVEGVARPAAATKASVAPAIVTSVVPTIPGGVLIPVYGLELSHLRDTFADARGGGRTHHAMDIMAPLGTPVVAAVDGTIRKLFNSKAGGISIYQFDVGQERVYYYAHLDRYADGLAEAQFVQQGTVIGYVGTTGNTRGTAHLHFAIEVLTAEKLWWKATPVNPYPILAASR
jgi:peptidoglycan LD-endopeptidase LytH